jgi:hypothetical protein
LDLSEYLFGCGHGYLKECDFPVKWHCDPLASVAHSLMIAGNGCIQMNKLLEIDGDKGKRARK